MQKISESEVQIMYRIDRLDFYILTAFKMKDEDNIITLNKPIDGITITEIMEYLSGVDIIKSRRTIYLHLNKLTQDGYTAKGIVSNHADTYYITDKGVKVLKGELL